jgi:hypothetical protein
MPDIKNILNLFCLSVKVFFVLLILVVIYYYNAYDIWGTFYFVTALVVFLINLYFYLENKILCKRKSLVFFDFSLVILGFVFASQLIDVFPPLFLLLLYVFSYFKESLVLLSLVIIGTVVKTFYGFFSEKDIIPVIFFSLAFYTLATRWDIFIFIRYRKLDSLSLKAKYQKLQRDLAFFSKKTKWLEDYEKVINKLSKLKAKEDTEKVLENLLEAEKVKIIPRKLKHTESLYENVVIDLDDIIVLIKPKGKYLLRDKDYKNKMEILFKLLKPYMESFLANRR